MATQRGTRIQQGQGQGARQQPVDTQREARYWQEQSQREPYYSSGEFLDEYEPAYRTGAEGRNQYAGQRFEDVEDDLRRDWESNGGGATLDWSKARLACRAAWDHAGRTLSGESDRAR